MDDKGASTFMKKANSEKLLVKNLAETNPSDIKSFFSALLTTPQNGEYYTAMLSVR